MIMVDSKMTSTCSGAESRCPSSLFLHSIGCTWILQFSSSSIHLHFSSPGTISVNGMFVLVGMNSYAIFRVTPFLWLLVLANSHVQGQFCFITVGSVALPPRNFTEHLSFLFFRDTLLHLHQSLCQSLLEFESCIYPKLAAYSFYLFTDTMD